eukprot:scaffold32662_cov101-Isochrysis_galbana.AAC.3
MPADGAAGRVLASRFFFPQRRFLGRHCDDLLPWTAGRTMSLRGNLRSILANPENRVRQLAKTQLAL